MGEGNEVMLVSLQELRLEHRKPAPGAKGPR
jgi:hypothetical protein